MDKQERFAVASIGELDRFFAYAQPVPTSHVLGHGVSPISTIETELVLVVE
jgi:hypothetical protein